MEKTCPFHPFIIRIRKEMERQGICSVMVEIVKDGESLPAKVVCVRNKRKEYLCLISTDIMSDEIEIICIYGKRWDIEVFFNVCKSCLRLGKEGNSIFVEVKAPSSIRNNF